MKNATATASPPTLRADDARKVARTPEVAATFAVVRAAFSRAWEPIFAAQPAGAALRELEARCAV
jgi:hypothetical protein